MDEQKNIGNPAVSIQGPAFGVRRIATRLITAREFSDPAKAEGANASSGSQRGAFAGLFLFTLLLYIRPNELFPEVFGTFPLARIVAVVAILAYVGSKLGGGERLTIMPIELKMLGIITLLGVLFAPLSAAPQDSIDVLLDLFLKVGIIFVLLINVIDTRERLRSLLSLVVVCGTIFAALAIKSYLVGEFVAVHRRDVGVVQLRIVGAVGGFFGNPNDLAVTLNMLLPLAVALTLLSGGVKRVFYAGCAAIMIGGVIVTFSRGGFLGLVAMCIVLLWKVGSQSRAMTALAFLLISGVFVLAMPGGYGGRVTSIFNLAEDQTGSTDARRDLLERAANVALHHPLVGVGMGNYHIYSVHEQVAHNSYLEIAAELGVGGLLAYLVFIFAPFRSLLRIERAHATPKGNSARDGTGDPNRELRYMCIAMQATLVAYIVCSFFGSIQYQWFLYYPVAYAIALRQIHAAQSPSSVTLQSAPLIMRVPERGVLFKKNQNQRAQLSALNRG
jgi:O-antigen ligase